MGRTGVVVSWGFGWRREGAGWRSVPSLGRGNSWSYVVIGAWAKNWGALGRSCGKGVDWSVSYCEVQCWRLEVSMWKRTAANYVHRAALGCFGWDIANGGTESLFSVNALSGSAH